LHPWKPTPNAAVAAVLAAVAEAAVIVEAVADMAAAAVAERGAVDSAVLEAEAALRVAAALALAGVVRPPVAAHQPADGALPPAVGRVDLGRAVGRGAVRILPIGPRITATGITATGAATGEMPARIAPTVGMAMAAVGAGAAMAGVASVLAWASPAVWPRPD
jgi:hypothetical protein